MNKSKYIVLKVSGNWIEQDQTERRIKFLLDGVPNVEVADEAIAKYSAWQAISNIPLEPGRKLNYETHVKMELARGLGYQLLKEGLIEFSKKEEEQSNIITATVTVIRRDEP